MNNIGIIGSSAKKSIIYDENNNNINKNIIKKKINFNDELTNYNNIQNTQNIIINKSPLKQENDQQLFIPEGSANINSNNLVIVNQIQPSEIQKNYFTLPPNKQQTRI